METLQSVFAQQTIEEKYNKKHIDRKVKEDIESSQFIMDKVDEGVAIVKDWLNQSYHDSKNIRIAPLMQMDLHDLVLQIFVGTAYFSEPELFSSVVGQLANRLRFDDKVSAITTMAEILAIVSDTEMYEITKAHEQGSLMLNSCIDLEEELYEFMDKARYLPPMVCTPLLLANNYSSGYLTHKDGLILGKGNQHSGDICLDVINTMNNVRLSLNTDFISKVEEEPTTEFTIENAMKSALEKGKKITTFEAREIVKKQKEYWPVFKKESYATYLTLAKNDNCFYLTHKVDMRGRLYSQGYHVNTEGVGHKKAMVELFNKEVVTGSFN